MAKGSQIAQRASESRLAWLLSVVHGPDGCVSKHYVLSDPFVRLDRHRHAQPTIQLDDSAVSTGTVHLELEEDGCYCIVDEGSRNGIRINGVHVDEARLEPQDVIRVGDSLLVIDRTDPTRRGSRRRADDNLLASLCMFESTARFVFESETNFFDDAHESIAIVADGFTESRQIAAWLALRWERRGATSRRRCGRGALDHWQRRIGRRGSLGTRRLHQYPGAQ